MKANFSYNNHINPNFKSLVSKTKTLKDVFYKNQFAQMQKKSINQIVDITPIQFAGTSCKGSIPLQNFWHFFKLKNPKLKSNYFGLSTNKDGYADSFLKEKSNVPLSTSFVHNCSAMYLYNDKTKTHALYHAAPDCSAEYLNSMIQRLMPEGISKAAIIPGDFFFYNEHSHNMNNMLKLIKQNSPNAKVNVYHDSTRFPEVVGYRGDVYEIPNKIVMKEMKINPLSAHDEGQASFKILDLQGANTLNEIYSKDLNTKRILERFFNDYHICAFSKLVNKSIIASLNHNQVQYAKDGYRFYEYIEKNKLNTIKINKDFNWNNFTTKNINGKKEYIYPAKYFRELLIERYGK